ncbi:MAG: stalk domain-containing protein [Bacillota bacterium]|jgi:spore germination protein
MSIAKNKLNKFILLLSLLLLFTVGTTSAMAAGNIKIYVNNTEVKCDAAPYTENSRTFIPMRYAAEPLGADVKWGNASKTATFIKDGNIIKVTLGSKTAYVNGKAQTLDAPAANKNGRTFVPIRFVSESLNCSCEWQNNAVYITTENDSKPNTDFKYLGYYFTYNALPDLKSYRNELTDVSHFAYNLKADGTIEKKAYYQTDKFVSEGQEIAEKAGHNIYMLVTGFTKADLTAVLSNPELRASAAKDIAAEMDKRGLDGVDIDFESVATDQRANYVTFIKELRKEIGKDKLINISAMPRSAASQTWLDGYDYGGLAEYADTISLMCYNEHYSGGSAGPVASYPWVKKVIEYTLSQGVDSEQIILALGSYGYDWPADGKASSVYNSAAIKNAETYGATIYRDTVSGCPFYVYYAEDGTKHSVWFEDATSLGQKASLAADYDLGGIGFWKLGNITDNIWASVLKATNHADAAEWQNQTTPDPVYPEQTIK